MKPGQVPAGPDVAAAFRLAAIVESSDDAIVSKDLNGLIATWNQAAERIFGYAAAEAIGRNITMIIPADRRHEEDLILSRIKSGKRIEHFETVRQRKDGSLINVSLSVSPVRDESGAVVGASKIARDITERFKAREAAYRLAAIVESSDDAIISKNLQGCITSWNKSAERIFGYTAAEACGQNITLIIPPELRHEEDQILARIHAGERVDHFETVRQRKDGSRMDVSITVSPVRDATGEIIGASKITRDITEAKQQAERQELLLHEIKHRVKNMLSTIDAIAIQTLKKLSPEIVEQFTARIHTLARAHELLTEEDWRGIDLASLIRQSLEVFTAGRSDRLAAQGPGVVLNANNSLLFALVFHELGTNALKYGAWSNDTGKVSLTWSVAADGAPEVVWEESGGPPVVAPERRGFGSTLIRRALNQSGTQGTMEFPKAGLVCRFRLAKVALA